MGTNYYFKHGEDSVHIGKRSSAGWFCLDCMAALNPLGNHAVHSDHELLEECPICGKSKDQMGAAFFFEKSCNYLRGGYESNIGI